jgi:hypothetical protein
LALACSALLAIGAEARSAESQSDAKHEAQRAACIEAMQQVIGSKEEAEKACTCRNSANGDDAGRSSGAGTLRVTRFEFEGD